MNSDVLHEIYCRQVPEFVERIGATEPMERLRGIGMNCGCEYTAFHMFRGMRPVGAEYAVPGAPGPYSRFDHSVGAALIVWHFTGDVRQSVSALLHDISTPVFAHVVDFLHGDHMKQESTEKDTAAFIADSPDLVRVLADYGLSPDDVSDYHRFPIADNDTPRLSSDRLEYTCGNALNYGFGSAGDIAGLYADLVAGRNGEGEEELVFRHADKASAFARLSLRCSKIYVCDADRYAMQYLALILADAIRRGVLSESDLYSTESGVLAALRYDAASAERWRRFTSFSHTETGEGPEAMVIDAKKRHIDPYVEGLGRVSSYDEGYRDSLREFLATDFSYPVYALQD